MYWINKPYVRRTANDLFTPIYRPNETYSFYMNLDRPITGTSDLVYKFRIIDTKNNLVIDMGWCPVMPLAGNNPTYVFTLYSIFNFPVIKDGTYYFQIWNSVGGYECARSNLILVQRDCLDTTCLIKATHNDDIYGYPFGGLFNGVFLIYRLPIAQIKPVEFVSERDQYRESSNGRNLRNSKSFRDMKINLEFYLACDDDHQALSALLEMDEVYIDGFRIINTKQIETQEMSPFSTKSKAIFEILLDEYNMDFSPTSPLTGLRIFSGGDSQQLAHNTVAGII